MEDASRISFWAGYLEHDSNNEEFNFFFKENILLRSILND